MLGFFLVWYSNGYDLARLQSIAPIILAHTANPTVACQDGNVFACRSERSSIFCLGFFTNPWIWLGIATEWMLIITIIDLPWLRQMFSTAPLTIWQCLLLFCCPVILLGVEEIRKVLSSKQKLKLPRK
jgi:magnesium-transporting ATPase (P-type)